VRNQYIIHLKGVREFANFGSVTPPTIEKHAAVGGKGERSESWKGMVAVREIDEQLGELHVRRKGCSAFCHLQASMNERFLTMRTQAGRRARSSLSDI
jgi:hypothetical protein